MLELRGTKLHVINQPRLHCLSVTAGRQISFAITVIAFAVLLASQNVSAASVDEIKSGLESIPALFEGSDYKQLGDLAESCRVFDQSSDPYVSSLARFYSQLPKPSVSADPTVWSTFEKKYVSWTEAQPQSVSALLALSNFYIAWANEIKNEAGAEGLLASAKAKLDRAKGVLDKAQALQPNDPEFHAARLKLAIGLGSPRSIADKEFEAGCAISKSYYPLYQAKALYLLPEYFGSTSDEIEFLNSELSGAVPDRQNVLAAMIADAMLRTIGVVTFEKTGLSWRQVKEGYLFALQNTDDRTFRLKGINALAYAGLAAHDHDFAKLILDNLNPQQIDLDLWGSTDAFQSARGLRTARPTTTPTH